MKEKKKIYFCVGTKYRKFINIENTLFIQNIEKKT
jgi:hypothetical protein